LNKSTATNAQGEGELIYQAHNNW